MDKLPPHTTNSKFSTKKGRSGYEPSDTETEWQEVPRHERERKNMALGPEDAKALTLMSKSPMALHRRHHHHSRFETETSSLTTTTASAPGQPRRRHHSKSPFKPRIAGGDDDDDDDGDDHASASSLNTRRNISPLPKPGLGRTVSPYNRKHHGSGLLEVDRVAEKPNYRRAVTAPRLRERQRSHVQNLGRTSSPLSRAMVLEAPSVGEINEMIAEVKLSKNPTTVDHSTLESTESIQPGDLFFSRECNTLQSKNSSMPKSIQQCGYHSTSPEVTTMNPIRGPSSSLQDHNSKGNSNINVNIRGTSSGNALSRSSSAATSRRGSSSLTSEASGKTTESMRKFTGNRKKSQKDAWFACMRRTSRKSPERRRPIDESSFIDRAVVVESLPQFWADKHQPASLNGFICSKLEAQLLKELVSFQTLAYGFHFQLVFLVNMS